MPYEYETRKVFGSIHNEARRHFCKSGKTVCSERLPDTLFYIGFSAGNPF